MKKISLCSLSALAFFTLGCTQLEPEIYNELPTDKFPATEAQLLTTIAPAYTTFRPLVWYIENDLFAQILSTDEAVILVRGGDWSNGGVYKRLFLHTWIPDNGSQGLTWTTAYPAISKINQILDQLNSTTIQVSTLPTKIAELKILRAYWYYRLLDSYRNIYIKTEFKDVDPPTQVDPQVAFDFIESEILNNLGALSENNDASTYGLITKGGARAILARLYLNSQVYTGKPNWDKCIEQCDSIILSEKYNLVSDFTSLFAPDNDKNGSSAENMFVVPFDENLNMGFWNYIMIGHWNSGPTFDNGTGAIAGISTFKSFVELYDKEDVRRKKLILEGPQFAKDGITPILSRTGQPLVHTLNYSSNDPWNENGTGGPPDNEGARLLKYPPSTTASWGGQGNDFVIFRYADVLLMKAESLSRLNKHDLALPLMNQVRTRSFPARPYTSVTLDSIYIERRKELAYEGSARQDMIRFDKFGGTWEFHPQGSDATKEIFPIPTAILNLNPTLKQNPGY